jgi:uncharacterized protein YebE (UPF0316 family)
MIWTVLSSALLIFALRLIEVSIGTIRTTMVVRGKRVEAAVLGFLEVSIWVVAASQVIGHLDTVWNVVGYSGGYVAGTLMGMWLEGRLALGHVDIHIVSINKGLEMAQKVRQAGYGATQLPAQGQSGPVHWIEVVAPRKQVAHLLRLVNEVDTTSFVTVTEARQVMHGYQHFVK